MSIDSGAGHFTNPPGLTGKGTMVFDGQQHVSSGGMGGGTAAAVDREATVKEASKQILQRFGQVFQDTMKNAGHVLHSTEEGQLKKQQQKFDHVVNNFLRAEKTYVLSIRRLNDKMMEYEWDYVAVLNGFEKIEEDRLENAREMLQNLWKLQIGMIRKSEECTNEALEELGQIDANGVVERLREKLQEVREHERTKEHGGEESRMRPDISVLTVVRDVDAAATYVRQLVKAILEIKSCERALANSLEGLLKKHGYGHTPLPAHFTQQLNTAVQIDSEGSTLKVGWTAVMTMLAAGTSPLHESVGSALEENVLPMLQQLSNELQTTRLMRAHDEGLKDINVAQQQHFKAKTVFDQRGAEMEERKRQLVLARQELKDHQNGVRRASAGGLSSSSLSSSGTTAVVGAILCGGGDTGGQEDGSSSSVGGGGNGDVSHSAEEAGGGSHSGRSTPDILDEATTVGRAASPSGGDHHYHRDGSTHGDDGGGVMIPTHDRRSSVGGDGAERVRSLMHQASRSLTTGVGELGSMLKLELGSSLSQKEHNIEQKLLQSTEDLKRAEAAYFASSYGVVEKQNHFSQVAVAVARSLMNLVSHFVEEWKSAMEGVFNAKMRQQVRNTIELLECVQSQIDGISPKADMCEFLSAQTQKTMLDGTDAEAYLGTFLYRSSRITVEMLALPENCEIGESETETNNSSDMITKCILVCDIDALASKGLASEMNAATAAADGGTSNCTDIFLPELDLTTHVFLLNSPLTVLMCPMFLSSYCTDIAS
jgi:hypothetical protein